MNRISRIILAAIFGVATMSCTKDSVEEIVVIPQSDYVAYFPMDQSSSMTIKEQISGRTTQINGLYTAPRTGVDGGAVRLDGHTNYAVATISDSRISNSGFSASLWCALQSYPVDGSGSVVDMTTYIVGNLDETAMSGFAFTLTCKGYYGFDFYADGELISLETSCQLSLTEWMKMDVTIINSTLYLYYNGERVAEHSFEGSANLKGSDLIIGKSFSETYDDSGNFELNMFNGMVDELAIFARPLTSLEISYTPPRTYPDYSADIERYADDILRPKFHAMPISNWTNEVHGLIRHNDQYHLFFQKGASGPYTARQYWGHLVSDDLVSWEELPVAIGPSTDIDYKGTWSGCILNDDDITGGEPYIVYTAVNSGAKMAYATPLDDSLIKWEKPANNVYIDGKPDGLSKDFRDPYTFEHDGERYMIVGTSAGDTNGAVTLHKYDKSSKTWSNDGTLFFKGYDEYITGNFWEMPVIEKFEDGKWFFCVIPTPDGNQTQGTEVQYWIGDINADGTFAPTAKYTNNFGVTDLDGMSWGGYGMLSPSVLNNGDGTMYAIGIVPDKLGTSYNADRDWAHTYCIPRVWSLDENDEIVQRPFEGLKVLRTDTKFEAAANTIVNGTMSMSPVSGRGVEVEATFKNSNMPSRFGFNLLQLGEHKLVVSYERDANTITIDGTATTRISNDSGTFDGVYKSELPRQLESGEDIKMHIFLDNSIIDIFINDTWASSVRMFTTNEEATGVECFSTGDVTLESCNAWVLSPQE